MAVAVALLALFLEVEFHYSSEPICTYHNPKNNRIMHLNHDTPKTLVKNFMLYLAGLALVYAQEVQGNCEHFYLAPFALHAYNVLSYALTVRSYCRH